MKIEATYFYVYRAVYCELMRILRVIVRVCVKTLVPPEEAYLFHNLIVIDQSTLRILAASSSLQKCANHAAQNGRVESINTLIASDVKPDIDLEQTLAYTFEFRQMKVFGKIRRFVFDTEKIAIWSARLGFVRALKYLFNGRISRFGEIATTVIRVAAIFNRINIFETFPNMVLDSFTKERGSCTLTFAAQCGHLDIVKFIVDRWCDHDIVHVTSAIESAGLYGHRDVVLYLIQFPNIDNVYDGADTKIIEWAFMAVAYPFDDQPSAKRFLHQHGITDFAMRNPVDRYMFMCELKELGATNYDEAFAGARDQTIMRQLIEWGATDFATAFGYAANDGDEKHMRVLLGLEKVYYKKVRNPINFDRAISDIDRNRQHSDEELNQITAIINRLKNENIQ